MRDLEVVFWIRLSGGAWPWNISNIYHYGIADSEGKYSSNNDLNCSYNSFASDGIASQSSRHSI